MKYINYYKTGIAILLFTCIFTAYKDYGTFLETFQTNKISTTAINTSSGKKMLSYSPTIKNLEQYEGISIVNVASSKENQDITTVKVEYNGNLKKGREIFNSISKDSNIIAIEHIFISDFNNNTTIKAEIDYLSNIICK